MEYVIPADEEQVVWVKWKTPSESTEFTLRATSNIGIIENRTINVAIVDKEEIIPPNPRGEDTSTSFILETGVSI